MSDQNDIGVIVGVRLSRVKPDCHKRLRAWLLWHQSADFKHLIIVDTSQNFLARRLMQKICHEFKAHYIHQPQKLHSPSAIRNTGMRFALSIGLTYGLFVDVDVLGQAGAMKALLEDVSNDLDFNWYPVQFTSEDLSLTTMLNWAKSNPSEFTGNLDQIGYATGIHLLSAQAWKALSGYDEDFIGYGCEDIDMIHRASLTYGNRPPMTKEPSYYEDYRTRDLKKYRGYRKWMFEQKKDVLLSDMWIHFYHIRKPNSKYLKARKENDILLAKKMEEFDEMQ